MNSWDKKLAIILPTYNESENIKQLLTSIRKIVPNAYILIVDDSNRTESERIKKIVTKFKNIRIVIRKKKMGRGSAVLAGFERAFKNNSIKYFVEMDTDLSHEPEELPDLYKALIAQNAQLVVGSRYIKESRVKNWPRRRLILSRIINFSLRIWLRVKIHDYTNGYRMYHRTVINQLLRRGLKEKNFITLSESVFLIQKMGYKIIEIPITFTDRKQGQSSVGIKELFLSLIGALRIRIRYNIQSNHTLKKDLLIALILFVIALGIRLPLYHTDFFKTPDAIEYINVAKQLNSGQGLTQSIKWHFFNNSPVITTAFEGKPVLTSIIFAPILYFFKDVYSLQIFLFFVMSISVVLFYFLGRFYLSPFFSFLAAFLFAINPNILISNRLILSEPMFYFFIISALLIDKLYIKKGIKFSLIGIFIALSYLTRNEGILLLIAFVIVYIKDFKYIALMIVTFSCTTSPYFYFNYLFNGNPLFSYNIYHFRVHHFMEGIYAPYNKVFPPANEFIQQNLYWIVSQILKRVLSSIQILLNMAFLGPMSIIVLLTIGKKIISKFKIFFLFALFVILNFSLIWSAFISPERHFAMPYILFLIPILYGIQNARKQKKVLGIILIVCTIAIYGAYDIHRISWARQEEPSTEPWSLERKGNLYNIIKAKTENNAIIASTNPHFVYLYTNRASIILPDKYMQEKNLKSFIEEYNISYIIVDDPKGVLRDAIKIYSSSNGTLYKVK